MIAYSIKQSHSENGKFGSTLAIPDSKCFLYDWMARSEKNLQLEYGVTSWYVVLLFFIALIK